MFCVVYCIFLRNFVEKLSEFRDTSQKMQPSFCLESHVSFNSRPNVGGTLVAVEKAASHSVSLFTIIVWEARSRYKAFQAHLAKLLDSRRLIFPFRFIIHFCRRRHSAGTGRGCVRAPHTLAWSIFDRTAVLDQPLHQERRPQFLF